MKKNKLQWFNRNFLILCLIASLSVIAISCDSTGPTPPQPPPTNNAPKIKSFNPTSGTVGTEVTINGKIFSSTKSENLVKFGTAKANVNSASKTKLVVTVPKGLTAGNSYEITVTVDGKTAATTGGFRVVAPTASAEPQPIDGVLETVTWNIEWFGYTNFGPKNEYVQANNVVKVADTLNADLYAFEEVQNKQALTKISSHMKGYKAIFEDTQNQGNGFVYNTKTIDAVSSGIIRKGQFTHAWAGRKPFYFSFKYHPKKGGKTILIYAVVIHAKAGADKKDYMRRVTAAQKLYNYLTNKKPNARIILLGDYNDELTNSIYNDKPTPYDDFVKDKTRYEPLTLILSKNNKTSEVNYQSVIDNIIISNEMVKYYKNGSAHVYMPKNGYIKNYGHTTSDHFPVKASFIMTR